MVLMILLELQQLQNILVGSLVAHQEEKDMETHMEDMVVDTGPTQMTTPRKNLEAKSLKKASLKMFHLRSQVKKRKLDRVNLLLLMRNLSLRECLKRLREENKKKVQMPLMPWTLLTKLLKNPQSNKMSFKNRRR